MDFVKFRDNHLQIPVITPVDAKNLLLFEHCSGGKRVVPTREFNAKVKPLLFRHGVISISVTDKT